MGAWSQSELREAPQLVFYSGAEGAPPLLAAGPQSEDDASLDGRRPFRGGQAIPTKFAFHDARPKAQFRPTSSARRAWRAEEVGIRKRTRSNSHWVVALELLAGEFNFEVQRI